MICMNPAQSVGSELNEWIEQLRNPALSVEEQEEIIKDKIRWENDGIRFFLIKDTESLLKEVQKMVLREMISMHSRPNGIPLSQRQKAADRYIPLVDSASEATTILYWDKIEKTGSLSISSTLTESQTRALISRARIGSAHEGGHLLTALQLAGVPDGELSRVVEDMLPHINDRSTGHNLFTKRGAIFRLPAPLITKLVNKTLSYPHSAHDVGRLMDAVGSGNPRYPLTDMWDHALSLIETGEEAVEFSKITGIIKRFPSERWDPHIELGKFIRRATPLIAHKDQVASILENTRSRIVRGAKDGYRIYLSEEDIKYFIDNTVHLFDSPEELQALPLERKELRYARKAMKTQARSGGARSAETTNDSLNKKGRLECLRGWLGLSKK